MTRIFFISFILTCSAYGQYSQKYSFKNSLYTKTIELEVSSSRVNLNKDAEVEIKLNNRPSSFKVRGPHQSKKGVRTTWFKFENFLSFDENLEDFSDIREQSRIVKAQFRKMQMQFEKVEKESLVIKTKHRFLNKIFFYIREILENKTIVLEFDENGIPVDFKENHKFEFFQKKHQYIPHPFYFDLPRGDAIAINFNVKAFSLDGIKNLTGSADLLLKKWKGNKLKTLSRFDDLKVDKDIDVDKYISYFDEEYHLQSFIFDLSGAFSDDKIAAALDEAKSFVAAIYSEYY